MSQIVYDDEMLDELENAKYYDYMAVGWTICTHDESEVNVDIQVEGGGLIA